MFNRSVWVGPNNPQVISLSLPLAGGKWSGITETELVSSTRSNGTDKWQEMKAVHIGIDGVNMYLEKEMIRYQKETSEISDVSVGENVRPMWFYDSPIQILIRPASKCNYHKLSEVSLMTWNGLVQHKNVDMCDCVRSKGKSKWTQIIGDGREWGWPQNRRH